MAVRPSLLPDEPRWQIRQRKICWESKPTSPSHGAQGCSCWKQCCFFQDYRAWGKGSWAFVSPHLSFSCQQPWPHSHFSCSIVNASVSFVGKQERGVNNKEANCHSTPHLAWKGQFKETLLTQSKRFRRHVVARPLNGRVQKEWLCKGVFIYQLGCLKMFLQLRDKKIKIKKLNGNLTN